MANNKKPAYASAHLAPPADQPCAKDTPRAFLALADGTVLEGHMFGAQRNARGEVVFNTSLVGYEEALTDPSYKGQILVLTYPMIGNYGVRPDTFESDRIQVEALVVQQASPAYQHRHACRSLHTFLCDMGVPGIAGIDTRLITRKIREHGVMNGVLLAGPCADKRVALDELDGIADIADIDLVPKVSVQKPVRFDCGGPKTVALVDLGVKNSIIRCLNGRGINVILLPHDSPASMVEEFRPDAVLLTNGPGNPERATSAIQTVKDLLGRLPLFGICLGHQILALAMGAQTYKLKFGHHGSNHPVKRVSDNRVFITSQNHNYAVRAESLRDGAEVTMVNLNDGSVEGLSNKAERVQSVQFHPEAAPGPTDLDGLFDQWRAML